MRRIIRFSAFLLLTVAFTLSLSACDSSGSNDSEPDPEEQNEAPTASANANETTVAVGAEVTLDASGSEDPDGDDLSFAWTLDAPDGSSAALSDDAAEKPTFTPDAAGEYTATVTVEDGSGAADDASVTITAETSSGNGGGSGTAEVTFSGDVDSAFDGYAYFYEGTDPDTDEEVFFIFLTKSDAETPDTDADHVLIARQSSRPEVGEHSFLSFDLESGYELSPNAFVSFAFTTEESASGYNSIYYADGGALTITQSSEDVVAGSINTDAVGIKGNGDSVEEIDATIEGTFTAVSSDAYFAPIPTVD